MKTTVIGGMLLVLAFTSCEPALIEPYETFTIPEGKHQKNFPLQTLQSNKLSFKAAFDETAIYESIDPINQHDIHKLMGFSDCNSQHHDNSARFGWRWLDGIIEIHAYVYNDKSRFTSYVGQVAPGEEHHYSIELKGDKYVFTLDNHVQEMDRTANCNKGLYYMLFPYFGGDEVAPHDINIRIRIEY